MKFKLDFIQSRILLEKQKLLSVLIVSIIIIGAFSIMGLYQYRGYLFGLKNIDTKEKIEKFYNSNYGNATLHFNNIVNMKKDIVVETTTESQSVFVGQYGGFVGSPTQTKKTTTYQLYKIEDKDFTIILCCDSGKNIFDFFNNKVDITNQYKKSKVNDQIIEEYSNGKSTYVFYIASNSKNFLNGLILVEIILIITLSIIRHSKLIHKTSKLAKNIQEFGKYEEIVKKLNMQVENAIYKSGNVVVCKDYILLLYKNSTRVITIVSIEATNYIPNEKYPDEIFTIQFIVNKDNYHFDVYDKDIKEKIINHIEKKIRRN